LKKDGQSSSWTREEIQVVNTVVYQFSLALENARLLEETQRRAERERRISEITARIRSSNDPEVILQTAAAELRNALKVTHSQIVINPAPELNQSSPKGNGHKLPLEISTASQESDTGQNQPTSQETE
jgi:hypothetical protein